MYPYRPLQLPDLNVVRNVVRDMENNAKEQNAVDEDRGDESF
eukprot:CAMPEP_0202023128 /NCGR_PEP_ID=MMETSP0905-20130828/51129_1 /ASSEMBLY_ACC=CAM_ASM_000554 /TAXON_ID=420261 /ORGANISM="Thalassiosira antarctica, Strain CCMP982" /LENGTH=41 /DNA_ID= /DNA_START= /DNA_END= /DNA_ORIENTATION=